jgi:hypothetical protein
VKTSSMRHEWHPEQLLSLLTGTPQAEVQMHLKVHSWSSWTETEQIHKIIYSQPVLKCLRNFVAY